MADNELVIKVSGDIKDFQDALKEAGKKTEDLSGELESLTKVSGVAFAALTGEVLLSVKAFGESQKASNQLSQALQNQGIFSEDLADSYKKQAAELQKLTGIDDDAIISAQGLLQGMIGQVEITPQLTKAFVDFSASGLDVHTAAQLIGKAIEGNTGVLSRYGIVIQDHLSKQERMAKIIEQVNIKFGDQAEAQNRGLGAIRGLQSAFSDFQENIGQRFAPFIEAATKGMTRFFETINENKALADFIVSLITAGGIVSSLGLAVGIAGIGFLKLKAALEAAEIATSAMSIATKGLIGATGLGLLIVLASEIYLNWSSIWPRMQRIYQAFIENVTDLSDGLGKVLRGVFKFDLTAVKAGLAQIKEAIAQGYNDATEEIDTGEDKQKEVQIKKKQEAANALFSIEKENEAIQLEQKQILNEQILAQEEEFQALNAEQKRLFLERNQADLANEIITTKNVKQVAALNEAKEQIKNNNALLLEEQKYGIAYATIHKQMHSEVYAGTKQAFGELAQLQTSSNATLKAIGKAAAIANIIIKTAESAMNIYAGFSTIPFIGPALGAVGAAAAVAFGAEQIGRVTAAAEGGLLAGGIPGVDSIPVLAQQGELVVPKKNYEEVVSAVADQRAAEETGSTGGYAQIVISLKDDLMDFIETKLVERTRLNLSIQGA